MQKSLTTWNKEIVHEKIITLLAVISKILIMSERGGQSRLFRAVALIPSIAKNKKARNAINNALAIRMQENSYTKTQCCLVKKCIFLH